MPPQSMLLATWPAVLKRFSIKTLFAHILQVLTHFLVQYEKKITFVKITINLIRKILTEAVKLMVI